MRIIAGAAKGRRLVAPRGLGTRPMTDRVKEALFSSLGAAVFDARVLDLYAGTGSLGLEALSRGAADATFVEQDRAALTALRANVAAVGLGGDIVAGSVERFLVDEGERFDLAFVDPPYALPLASLNDVLSRLTASLVRGAVVVLHRRHGDEAQAAVPSLVVTDRRHYGSAELWRFAKEEM
jgi:16S rRNA (guanine966-N2)-methyltransferase